MCIFTADKVAVVHALTHCQRSSCSEESCITPTSVAKPRLKVSMPSEAYSMYDLKRYRTSVSICLRCASSASMSDSRSM